MKNQSPLLVVATIALTLLSNSVSHADAQYAAFLAKQAKQADSVLGKVANSLRQGGYAVKGEIKALGSGKDTVFTADLEDGSKVIFQRSVKAGEMKFIAARTPHAHAYYQTSVEKGVKDNSTVVVRVAATRELTYLDDSMKRIEGSTVPGSTGSDVFAIGDSSAGRRVAKGVTPPQGSAARAWISDEGNTLSLKLPGEVEFAHASFKDKKLEGVTVFFRSATGALMKQFYPITKSTVKGSQAEFAPGMAAAHRMDELEKSRAFNQGVLDRPESHGFDLTVASHNLDAIEQQQRQVRAGSTFQTATFTDRFSLGKPLKAVVVADDSFLSLNRAAEQTTRTISKGVVN